MIGMAAMAGKPLIKALIIGVIALAICAGFYFMFIAIKSSGVDEGVAAENSRWLEVRAAEQLDEARERSRISEAAAKTRATLLGANNVTEKENTKLRSTMAYMRDSGLSIAYSKIDAHKNCASREDPDPQVEGGTTKRIRLPGAIEEGLFGLSEDAQKVVFQYNELRTIVVALPCVEIVE